MIKFISKVMKLSIISSLVLVAFGILLIAQSEATILAISYIIGALLIAVGVIAGINYIKNIKETTRNELEIVYTLVCVILGIIVINNPEAIASIIPLVIGVIIVINSATKLEYSIELRKAENELWVSTLILSIIMLVCGIILIFNPFKGAILLTRIVGIFILIYAILDLVSTVIIKNSFKAAENTVKEAIKDAEIVEDHTNRKKIGHKKNNKKEEKTEDNAKNDTQESNDKTEKEDSEEE